MHFKTDLATHLALKNFIYSYLYILHFTFYCIHLNCVCVKDHIKLNASKYILSISTVLLLLLHFLLILFLLFNFSHLHFDLKEKAKNKKTNDLRENWLVKCTQWMLSKEETNILCLNLKMPFESTLFLSVCVSLFRFDVRCWHCFQFKN